LFQAQCSPYETNGALYPMIDMLSRRLALTDSATTGSRLSALERFVDRRGVSADDAVPLIAALLSIPTGDRYADSDLPPAKRRQRTLEILADLLLSSPGGEPTLLLIEDVHWADPSTLDLLSV